MKRLVVGTAGHIDHGKTSLVRALTGIDTDRLKEEKARGITIELGFAPLNLPGGERLAFIDVPGHERFVRTMIAGATGIDAVLLVIAADEGVMPQTREHLAILELLGVRQGAVVLSRVDLVDEELLELAIEDVRDFTRGTFLAEAPVLPVSSITGWGIPELLSLLQGWTHALKERSAEGPARLPIDRVFSLRGFGTVVTGTLVAGQLSTGEQLELLPGELRLKVRGMQVHGQEVSQARAGQRVALNLQGIDRDKLERGMQLATPGRLLSTSMLDVYYQHLPSASLTLEHRCRIRFLSGTTEVTGVVHLLEVDGLEPGQSGWVQLRLDAPTVARAGDRFILRLESPLETLGGGEVIDPAPPRHRRRAKKDAAARLARLRQATLEEEVLIWLELVGAAGLQVDQLARRSRRSQEQLRGALLQAEAREQAVALDQDKREFVDPEVVEAGVESLLQALQQYHHRHPLRSGATRGELRDMLPWYAERVFLKTLEKAVAAGSLTADGALFRRTEFEVRLSESEQALADSLIDLLEKAEFSPPLTSELQESLKSDEARLVAILGVLGRRGLVRKIKEGHWMSATALDRLQGVIVDHLRSAGELTPTQFKELTGLSRKWAIPLLEYFDKIQLTLRVGDVRRLRGG